ncbi:hypothetical protein DHW03_16595 [Pedobacter yonginense]|uniref:Glycosyltransferase 2-like domain-containing protein n=1 Tax=Pedobacter yonginense TaxID=651869 RepID=A0A317EJY9_9SPHI|nr:glycosyltransferase family 2 protein [Pedobacter yonginense]PWS26399.1 hypothetical protein DHW03_16595 [Pedobacter yonginense]
MEPLVSVVIPLFNAEKYIATAIESIINQSHQNCEIIVVDDGSTDQSFQVARRYQSNRVTLIQQQNKGASAARNEGLKLAKGEYIQFLDADDFLGKDKIKHQIELIRNQIDILVLGPTVYFQDGQDPFTTPFTHEWFSAGSNNPIDFLTKLYGADLIGQNYGGMIQPNAWLVPKSIIDQAGAWNETLTLDDDGEYFCRVVLASKSILYAPTSINYYRKFASNQNLSSIATEQAFRSSIKSTQLKHQHLQPHIEKQLSDKIFKRLYWGIAIQLYPKYLKLFKELAVQLGKDKVDGFYTHTKFYRLITKYFGWKTSAWLSYIKNGR